MGLALRCPPRADSGPERSKVKLRLLEPVAPSWIIAAGQPGVLETPLLLAVLPLPKVFCHQLSEEQHSAALRTPAAARAACEPPAWGQRRSSAQPEQRQSHRDGAGGTDPPMANMAVAGLRLPKAKSSLRKSLDGVIPAPAHSPMAAPGSALQHPWSWKILVPCTHHCCHNTIVGQDQES